MINILAYDVEATGVDLWNGCLPYMFQFHGYHPLDQDPMMPENLKHLTESNARDWTYIITCPVDPFTRLPEYKPRELDAVHYLLMNYPIVAHNAKFDIRATEQAFRYADDLWNIPRWEYEWDWDNIYDTIHYAHAFRNYWGLSLKNLRKIFWCVGEHKMNAMKQAVNQARRICRTKTFIEQHGEWRIAEPSDPHWPATDRPPKEKDEDVSGWWWYDTWLPRAIATNAPEFLPEHNGYYEGQFSIDHPWHNVSQLYGEEDVLTTLPMLFLLMEIIEENGHTDLVQQRHELLEVTYQMETIGIPLKDSIQDEIDRYQEQKLDYENRCLEIAERWWTYPEDNEEFSLTSTKAIRRLLYKDFALKAPSHTKTGLETLKEEHMQNLAEKSEGDPHDFLNFYLLSKKNEKSRKTLQSYLDRSREENYNSIYIARVMHGNYNITGTKFLRQSSSGPNLQNIATGEQADKAVVDEYLEELLREKGIEYNLRENIGPDDGYQILSLDYQSIEFYIWAFSCGNQEVQDCYKLGISPFKPVMEAVHGFFDKDAPEYKPTKNGIYSMLYGSGEANSNRTFKKKNAVRAIKDRMPEVRTFTNRLHRLVRKQGHIDTLAGYSLRIPLDEPHKAVSAFVQGHAGWVIGQAMILCHHYLKELNATRAYDQQINLIMQVHDELNFHGPFSFHEEEGLPLSEVEEITLLAHQTEENPSLDNPITIGEQLIALMRLAGEKYGIPTPVNASLFTEDWGHSEDVTDHILAPIHRIAAFNS